LVVIDGIGVSLLADGSLTPITRLGGALALIMFTGAALAGGSWNVEGAS